MMYQNQYSGNQLQQCRQTAQQLIQQTQQSSQQYKQMLQQEQQNIQMLQQMLNHEQHAVHTIQQALQGHELAIHKCQQIVNVCNQLQQEVSGHMPAPMANANVSSFPQTQHHTPFQQHSYQQ
ncbi:YxeD [Bacillus velezensis]|nr:YxeD [Bacillus velezensis]QDF54307.1 YxeD [Bacillus velezensis]